MKRKIIKIDREKCDGCGLCVGACHEGAIGLRDGKAVLLREDYCDGLGDCLPICPQKAIAFEEREALYFDAAAVEKSKKLPCGCPSSNAKVLVRKLKVQTQAYSGGESMLAQWPVQIKLAPSNAPYFLNADLLIAADCSAYAFCGFHEKFMKNKITLIGCPKLDSVDYAEKLCEIIKSNDVKSVTVVRMEVPCCGGIETAVKSALMNSGRFLPWQVVTVSTDGRIL